MFLNELSNQNINSMLPIEKVYEKLKKNFNNNNNISVITYLVC